MEPVWWSGHQTFRFAFIKKNNKIEKKLKYFLIQLHFFLLSKPSETSKKSILGSDPFLRGGLRDGQVKRADYFEAELIF